MESEIVAEAAGVSKKESDAEIKLLEIKSKEQPRVKSYTIDEALDRCIGPFGRWQLRISVLCSLLKFPIAWFQLGIVFLAPSTEFWCRRPKEYANVTLNNWLQMISINRTKGNLHRQQYLNGSCYMRNPLNETRETYIVPCLWGYEFNTKSVHSSIITEWQLICGREKLIDVAQTVLMLGVLLGTITLGVASDRFGRKPVLISCLAVQAIAGSITSLAPNYLLFLLARFITAFANAGTMVSSFVICMEIVGGKWRTIIPILYQIPFGIGNTLMAIIAYFVRDWREFQLVLSLLCVIYMVYWKYLPESPRWLIAIGCKEKALPILEKAAKDNNKSVQAVANIINNISDEHLITPQNRPNISALFRSPSIRSKSIFLCIHWFFAGISFYGFGQYMGQVSNHLYVTVMIGGLISLPGTVICCFITQRYGRRLTIGCAHIYTAFCYVGIMSVPRGIYFLDWPRILFAAMGVIGLSVSTPALYLFTGEMFPTVLRNAGLGATLTCSRVGSMLAPFVNAMSRFSDFMSLFVLVICVIIEALLLIPLPETKDIALPDSISDVEKNSGEHLNEEPKSNNYIVIPKEDNIN